MSEPVGQSGLSLDEIVRLHDLASADKRRVWIQEDGSTAKKSDIAKIAERIGFLRPLLHRLNSVNMEATAQMLNHVRDRVIGDPRLEALFNAAVQKFNKVTTRHSVEGLSVPAQSTKRADAKPYVLFSNVRVYAKQGTIQDEAPDGISKEKVAVVNPAREDLQGAGGVAGVLRRAGGKPYTAACEAERRELGRDLKPGEVTSTTSGDLKNAGTVIHAIGPRWNEGLSLEEKKTKREQLYQAYYNSLAKAKDLQMDAVILPCISIGIFGFPEEEAAVIAAHAIRNFLQQNGDFDPRGGITICHPAEATAALYLNALKEIET